MDKDQVLALATALHRKEIDRLQATGQLPPQEPARIAHTELPELPRDHRLHREWNAYRRQVASLIAAGCENTWVLIKGDDVLGVYGRWEHAYIAAMEKSLQPAFMIHQVLANDYVSRLERHQISWPLSPSPLAKTA